MKCILRCSACVHWEYLCRTKSYLYRTTLLGNIQGKLNNNHGTPEITISFLVAQKNVSLQIWLWPTPSLSVFSLCLCLTLQQLCGKALFCEGLVHGSALTLLTDISSLYSSVLTSIHPFFPFSFSSKGNWLSQCLWWHHYRKKEGEEESEAWWEIIIPSAYDEVTHSLHH